MKAPINRLIVKAEGLYKYTEEFGSLKLWVDPMFKKGQRRIKQAEVVAIPNGMMDWCKIVPEVKVGDTVYMHHNALTEDGILPEGENLFMVEYDMIFCTVRYCEKCKKRKIYPIGGKILALPTYDDDVVEMDVNGEKKRVRVSKSGIITELNVRHSLKSATLAYIGTPLSDASPVPIRVGQTFYYIKNADFINTIEGKDYFVMDQEDILAIES